ncbi:glycosyltransferase family 4 protein [Salidesulfovibrio brasiliensis]|uniref:glycosyltransferase family 4 protein n=1 Tax=Salidesulfovibrio brasiliensis TaxID=221711 RepID=UPI0006D0DC04|nr:glycosyltransferase family 4 protein [Salidesulfovibrio brasiliensis]
MSGYRERIWGTLDPFFEPGPVLGRKVANEWFLRSLLRADPFDAYHFFLESGPVRDRVAVVLRDEFPALGGKIRLLDRRDLPAMLAETEYYCFHQSDCISLQPMLAALRNEKARSIFPITGTIHSLSYSQYGEMFLRHLSPGTTGRDAVVCTSRPGREAVGRIFVMLRTNYALDPERFPAPTLACIPLGVDPEVFRPRKDTADGPCRFLVFGRISHFSKMDLLPLLRAFQRLFADGLAREAVQLVLAGWTEDNDDFLPTLRELARNIGLALEVHERPGDEEKVRLFESADVFVSIADNPQETFGITVLEAAAAGLPALVSDYDGYRDLVEDGVTGLRIPVIGPDRTPQADRMAPLTFDSSYHLTLAQQTAVSTPRLAEAMAELVRDPEKRLAMGRAARTMVTEQYGGPAVIRQYVTLWDELWSEPVNESVVRGAGHPSRIEYARVFGGYPTQVLTDELTVRAGRTGNAVYRGQDHVLPYAGVERLVNPDHARVLAFLARKPITCGELVLRLTQSEGVSGETASYTILWALKHDILETAD